MKEIGIIDIEASGLHFDSYPIEVAVLLRGEHKSWLIKPEPSWQYWCTTAESMHGISRDKLMQYGLPAAEVVKQLNAFLKKTDVVLYSDAHHWDDDWINTLYYAAKVDKPFYVDSIYEVMGNDKANQFDKYFAQLAESGQYKHHRAADDARMIYEAYRQVVGWHQ
jgi:DNA polymerase III epsilon subunit-like protein